MQIRTLYSFVTLAAAASMIAACTSPMPQEPEDSPTETVSSVDEEPADGGLAAAEGSDAPVQDTWIYERMRAVTTEGMVDVSEELVDGLTVEEDDAVDLTDGVSFVPLTDPVWVARPDGTPRDDLDVVGGVVRTSEGEKLQIIATPLESRSITAEDRILLDLSHLGLDAGTPLVVDFAFGQGLPLDGDDASIGSAELLSHRMSEERFSWYAEEIDGETEPGILTVFGAVPDETVLSDASFTGEAHVRDGLYRPGSAEIISVDGGGGIGGVPAKALPVLGPLVKLGKCVGSPLKCLSKYFKGMKEGAEESLDDIFEKNDPSPPPEPCRGPCGGGHGEPHMLTFDQHRYDLQLVGEFVLAEAPDFTVQVRTEPARSSTVVSMITAVAIQAGDERFTVDIAREEPLWQAGAPVGSGSVGERPYQITFDDGELSESAGQITISGPNGARAIVQLMGSLHADVVVDPGAITNWSGLLGTPDSDVENDLTARDGTVVPLDADTSELYGTFGDSWRITDEESLFDYASGESTATHTDLDFPSKHLTADDLDPEQLALGRSLCRMAGTVVDADIESCAFDYVVTGNMDFVNSFALGTAMRGELPEGWITELTGATNSHFEAIADELRDQVLIRSRVENGDDVHIDVTALDLASGEENWTTSVGTDACLALNDADQLVVASHYPEAGPMIEILDPDDGSSTSKTETELGACTAALSAGEAVLVRSGETIAGFDGDESLFQTEIEGMTGGPVLSGDGQVWLTRSLEDEGLAVTLDPQTGQTNEFPLPKNPHKNISPREVGFVVGYSQDDDGLMWVEPNGGSLDVDLSPGPYSFADEEFSWKLNGPIATDGTHHAVYIGSGAVGIFDSTNGELTQVAHASSFENNGSQIALSNGTIAVGLFTGGNGAWMELHDAVLGELVWASDTEKEIGENTGVRTGDAKRIGPFLRDGTLIVQANSEDRIVVARVGPGT